MRAPQVAAVQRFVPSVVSVARSPSPISAGPARTICKSSTGVTTLRTLVCTSSGCAPHPRTGGFFQAHQVASSPSSCSAPSTPILPMTAAGTLQGPQRAATAVLSSPRSALPSAAVLSSNPIRQATSPGPAARQAPVPPVPLLDFHRPLADLAASNPSEFSPRIRFGSDIFAKKTMWIRTC